jgi:hypothetical protein
MTILCVSLGVVFVGQVAAARGVSFPKVFVGHLTDVETQTAWTDDNGTFSGYDATATFSNLVFGDGVEGAYTLLKGDLNFSGFTVTQTVRGSTGTCTATYHFVLDSTKPLVGDLGSFSEEAGGTWHVGIQLGVQATGSIVSSSGCGPNNESTSDPFGEPARIGIPISTMGTFQPRTGIITVDWPSQFVFHDGTQMHDVTGELSGGQVELTVSPSPTTLGRRVVLQARLKPSSPPATHYEWQIKRANAANWTTYASTQKDMLEVKAKVAGHLDVRVIATGNGVNAVSDKESLVVQFPNFKEIAANGGVKGFTLAGWNDALSAADPTSVQEVGFWIYLDSCTGKYGHTGDKFGPRGDPRNPDDTPEVSIAPKPPDDPPDPKVTDCSTYIVASFHTHTARLYAVKGRVYPVGPSKEDDTVNANYGVPGLVYDYTADPTCHSPSGAPCVRAGYKLGEHAENYPSGPNRRETPP